MAAVELFLTFDLIRISELLVVKRSQDFLNLFYAIHFPASFNKTVHPHNISSNVKASFFEYFSKAKKKTLTFGFTLLGLVEVKIGEEKQGESPF